MIDGLQVHAHEFAALVSRIVPLSASISYDVGPCCTRFPNPDVVTSKFRQTRKVGLGVKDKDDQPLPPEFAGRKRMRKKSCQAELSSQ